MLTTLVLLIASFIFSLQFKPVQTYVAKKVANYLSGELKTKVEVGSLYIKPFKSLVLEGLYIEDQEKDTLFYSKSFTVDLNLLSLKLRKISVNTATIDNGRFYLKKYTDKTTNLAFIINYFNTGNPDVKKKPRKPYDITFDKIVLNNVAFRYKNFNSTAIIKGINFNDLDLRNINSTILGLDTKTHLLKADFKNLTFREKSGFYLKNLTTNAIIDKDQMEFKQLLLETPDTRLTDYFLMKYSSFKDFQKFVDKVYMKAHFNNARLNSRDIDFFAPKAFSKTNMQLNLDGSASGYVKDLKAKDLALRTGQATYLKGDFEIKGLPNIKTTLLDLKFDQLATNKKDIDYLLAKFSNNKKVNIPPIAGKFGDISFQGNFKGFINDFSTDGEFKTRLGRIVSDIEFKTDKNNNPIYKGTIQTFDFNLGDLLNQKTLGRTTLTANIDGSGFKLNKLKQQIETNIDYFDFKGYRYTNIELNGEFYNKLFDGQMKINDRNIKLDFNGKVDLNPQLPVFNFNAVIRNANLNALKLTKDTLQINADFNTNFSGNNLDNIQGRVDISKIQFTSKQKSYAMNSVAVLAEGIGVKRLLTVRSDILDASIEGDYDLKTLPSYFKTIVKRYVPSLQLSIVKPGNQNFEFKLNMKYFEPLSLLLNIPKLKISDQFTLNGKFVSSENVATLSGYAKLIEYDKIKIHNLIVDENATANNLNLFITSDRVDLTDSLFIKNVNIANTLRNDSLSLNIKLSDKDAINQLDLNSLVEFSSEPDSAIKLSLLPSDVIINNEVWRIQEQVRIKFDVGKKPQDKFSLLRRTKIEGFQLFRDNQMLTIDGFISKNPADELLLGFNKFKLTTFNTLTKSLGISLSGTLNGNAKLSAIGKTPRVEAALTIDSLKYNAITIGDLNLAANLDNKTKLIDVKMDIFNQGEKTLDISGTYNSAVEKNNLDMDVRMKDNQIILFEPLLKKLVSNLKGTVSSELKVTGELKKPKIKGTLSLRDAELTVNYLKTPYHITDKVTVENSIITLKNLIIKDLNNNEAKVNGTVDMANPNNPDININIAATKFMALNTTAKDNPLYYGTAFSTGRFTFNGPTNNMRINIAARTEDGTVFNIPLNSSEKVSDKDFITFVTKDSTLTDRKASSFNGLTMNFDLEVNEKSEVNIITQLGKLTGRGTGSLNLNITSLGDFEMFGDYIISKGKFDFTAKDIFNKIFEIREGGSIRWTGNPTEAVINLKAFYAVRTTLNDLYIAAGRTQTEEKRVLAEAVMNLSGYLLKPDITFDVNFPADPSVKDEFQSYFSDVNNTTNQALSLILRRGFFAAQTDEKSLDIANLAGSTFARAGSELIFNQLNTIIRSLNLDFVDLNFKSLNEASASLRFLNDRLVITGGVTDRKSIDGAFSDFNVLGVGNAARDLELQYLIKKDGSLVLRLSNRANNQNFLNSASSLTTKDIDYVTAAGLVYRQDFDTPKEFLNILIGKNRREERRKKALEELNKDKALKPEEENKENPD